MSQKIHSVCINIGPAVDVSALGKGLMRGNSPSNPPWDRCVGLPGSRSGPAFCCVLSWVHGHIDPERLTFCAIYILSPWHFDQSLKSRRLATCISRLHALLLRSKRHGFSVIGADAPQGHRFSRRTASDPSPGGFHKCVKLGIWTGCGEPANLDTCRVPQMGPAWRHVLSGQVTSSLPFLGLECVQDAQAGAAPWSRGELTADVTVTWPALHTFPLTAGKQKGLCIPFKLWHYRLFHSNNEN